ncbi:HsdM family class I SAM-dependent methyltransferase [Thioalkalivibrio denitrificans]|nr:N-6 DNA methylase [Thioalkalivibrio denitrificans]
MTQRWLEAWGYTRAREGLHRRGDSASPLHAYRNEIQELLDPGNEIRATAVFDVEGVPTVCFIEDDGSLANSQESLNRIREKIWNQNLISVALVVNLDQALALPVGRKTLEPERITWAQREPNGPYSCRGIQTGELFRRHKDWFEPEDRVDEQLLKNLKHMVEELIGFGLTKVDAQYLMAQVLFISYLEHRDIVGDRYRRKHHLRCFETLVQDGDRRGIVRLIKRLKTDLNGDFLEPETKGSGLWKALSDDALELLYRFLQREDLDGGQRSLWRYDFRYIPVELLSGIYETFLADDKREVGAYYTPRHLANLAVDQAFRHSPDILSERVYDGACGSGILLTTAYRRMLSYAQAKARKPLSFRERRKLLEGHIFGSDLNKSACRVTAFSLYLSMLEGLQPTDISKLQDNSRVKLPNLSQGNIIGGVDRGDFFSNRNPHANSHNFTILLSNPPWVEPKGRTDLPSDTWAAENGFKLPRRQTAAAFMLRARDCLAPEGRLCLILPVSVAAAPTSGKFIGDWLDYYEPETLINFGDLRKLLFSTARQPCMIAVGRPRPHDQVRQISGRETFEYWVPKADISLAFGRLTLHSQDRHELSTRFIQMDNEPLTTLFWGTKQDMATISSLRMMGRLGDMIGKDGPWSNRKGYHVHDASITDPVSSRPLRELPFLDARKFHVDGPVLDKVLLEDFPSDIKTLARLPDALMAAFSGPKIVFTDGITSDRKVRAAFSSEAFTFKHSIGMLSGPPRDEPLMRFVAAYLHSSLVQYILLMTAYQVNFERERVSLKDIQRLPFMHPDRHEHSGRAWQIVKEVSEQTKQFENAGGILQQGSDPKKRDELILEYFGLDRLQKERIKEVSTLIAPNLQPGTIKALDTPLQQRAHQKQLTAYGRSLRDEIRAWSRARGGVGDVMVEVMANSTHVCGPLGIVKVTPAPRGGRVREKLQAEADDKAFNAVLEALGKKGLLPLDAGSLLQLAPDTVVRSGDTLYLVKPLLQRLWLHSEAYRDAERIVRRVMTAPRDLEVAQ